MNTKTPIVSDKNIDDLELRFPAMRTAEQKWCFFLSYVVVAPSVRNTQPWLWKIDGEDIKLYYDHSRLLPAMDPNGRESIISCGAALLHLRLALRHFGYDGKVDYMPDESDSHLLARVHFGKRLRPTIDEDLLFYAIPNRHTNRGTFDEREVPETILTTLRQEATSEGAWLQFVEGEYHWEVLLELISKGDKIQWSDSDFRSDVAKWLRPNNSCQEDGVAGSAIGIGDLASHLAPLALRFIDWGQNAAETDSSRAGNSAVLAILGTDSDSPYEWLKAGEALARVLLRGCAHGLDASFFNQPVELIGLWPQLRQVLGRNGFPQMIFRLGHANEGANATPRRSPDQVVVTQNTFE